MTVGLNNLSDLLRKRIAVAAYYFVPGVVFASWASRIPDVKQMLHLTNGQLGSVLFAIPIGQLLMMAFSGVLVSKFGSKKMIVLAEVLYALVLFSIGSSSTVFQLILSLVAFGMMANLMNIATNTQACLIEKMYGRNIMSSFHGLWSLGGFSGGIIGAVFANTLLPIEAHFGTILVMSLIIIAVGFRFLVDDATAKAEEEDVPKFSFRTIDPILFLLGLMGFAGMFCEGTVYDWSGVYFSSVVKPDEAFIRAGCGRYGSDDLGPFPCRWICYEIWTSQGAESLWRFDSRWFVVGCCFALSHSCYLWFLAGRFWNIFVCSYLL